MTDIAKRLLTLAGNINLRPEESELCADAAEEIERLRSRVAELEARIAFLEGGPMPRPNVAAIRAEAKANPDDKGLQLLSAAEQIENGTATITKHFPDSGTPRVDVREVVGFLEEGKWRIGS